MTTHAAGWTSESPTSAQLSEFFKQVNSGRITKIRLQKFLGNHKFLDFLDHQTVHGTTGFNPYTFFTKKIRSRFPPRERRAKYGVSSTFLRDICLDEEQAHEGALIGVCAVKERVSDEEIQLEFINHPFGPVGISTWHLAQLLEMHRVEGRGLLNTDGRSNICYLHSGEMKERTVEVKYDLEDRRWSLNVWKFNGHIWDPGTRVIYLR